MSAIPAGYKQTEVGVIPVDWEDLPLGDVSEIHVGRDLIEDRFSQALDLRFRFPVFSNTVSNSGLYGYYSTPEYEGDSLTVVGRGVGLGTAFARTGGYGAIGRLLVLFPVHHRADAQYLTSYINHRVTIFVETSGIPQLTGIQFAKYKVVLPPFPEQRTIATALSDVDALLAKLDEFIDKKRDLKQAAMQQLLTGQTRLPGFSGEWEVKRLGDVSEIVMGQSPSSSYYNAKGLGRPLIQGNADIANRKTIRRIFTTEITKYGKRGDILMSVRAPVGEISRAVFDVCLGRGVCAIRHKSDFMYHYLISLEPSWARLSKGSTFDSVNSADVRALEVCLPTDDAEQTAIATILSDMDTELAALEARRDKTRALKQAMMQELLTGKTRLV